MAEAVELLDELMARVPELDSERLDITPFSLESGEELLRAVFEEVRLFERPDQMLVTEPEPLIRYVLSLIDQPLEEVLGPVDGAATRRQRHARAQFEQWRRSVEARLETEAVVVRRVSGFFEAL